MDELVKAQNDARFAEVNAKLDGLSDALRDKPGIGWLIGVGFAGFLGVVGVLAFGGDRFDGGVQVQSSVSDTLRATQNLSEANAKAITALTNSVQDQNAKVQQILEAVTREGGQ